MDMIVMVCGPDMLTVTNYPWATKKEATERYPGEEFSCEDSPFALSISCFLFFGDEISVSIVI
jgi:hypothetical protein